MRFKVDENLHEDVVSVLRTHGHDATSIHEQGMRGFADARIAEVCRREGRAIVTQDLDFANIVAYPPENYPGIVVFRLHDPSRDTVVHVLEHFLPSMELGSLPGSLWVITESGIRIHKPPEE